MHMAFDERVTLTSKPLITILSLIAKGFQIQMLDMDKRPEKPTILIEPRKHLPQS